MPSGSSYPQPTAVVQQIYEAITERLLRSYPIKDYPLCIRPGMIFVTAAWLILLGILGMAPLPELPINDKALHFFGLGFATFLLYFIIEVPEGPARRVWYIRRAPLLFTLVTGFFVGGILSEFFQGLLPWKTFQWGDIAANLLGSSLFLYLAHLLHTRHRKRSELAALYQPLNYRSSSTYRDAQGREHAFDANSSSPAQANSAAESTYPYRHTRQGSNVWEADSEGRQSIDSPGRSTYANLAAEGGSDRIFDIGDDDDPTPTTQNQRI